MSIYDYSIRKLNSTEEINLKDFKGKKILFVNVASKCGFTPQYRELEELYLKYKDQLIIIGFPCNQFLWQESGSEEKIASFCQLKYDISFSLTEKIKVKGSHKHPIYQWLTDKSKNDKNDYKVSWNFNKFLVDEKGKLINHFNSKTTPLSTEITKHFYNKV